MAQAYSVSKAGTVHLAKSLAKACAPARVNAVAAGVMLTEWSKGFTEEHVEKVKQTNALNMICEVEDVASQYVSLCENKSITVSQARERKRGAWLTLAGPDHRG
jgi:NAD(P)-dependent dehydrogenase (short-subunit alcohol dehydrogenase family)